LLISVRTHPKQRDTGNFDQVDELRRLLFGTAGGDGGDGAWTAAAAAAAADDDADEAGGAAAPRARLQRHDLFTDLKACRRMAHLALYFP
ncbi:hypothetical protein HK405_007168, partial [Cladochytrium tenue]